jgi:hypothetical protein
LTRLPAALAMLGDSQRTLSQEVIYALHCVGADGKFVAIFKIP